MAQCDLMFVYFPLIVDVKSVAGIKGLISAIQGEFLNFRSIGEDFVGILIRVIAGDSIGEFLVLDHRCVVDLKFPIQRDNQWDSMEVRFLDVAGMQSGRTEGKMEWSATTGGQKF